MIFQEAFLAVEDLRVAIPSLFDGVEIVVAFGPGRPAVGHWGDEEKIGMLVTGDGIGNKSGLYFFSSSAGEIIYIGKATRNNLHYRVWDHMKTPLALEDGRRVFPKHEFTYAEGDVCHEEILEGRIHLDVITISDSELVSLVEVFLHILHKKKHGRLPVFNRQIG